LSDSTIANPVATPAVTTQYNVLVTDSFTCQNTASTTITVNPIPVGITTNDTTFCEGQSVQLLAAGGTIYNWSPAAGLSCTTCADPLASPVTTTQYFVTITNQFACTITDSITITIEPLPVIVTTPDQAICAGETIQLAASGGVLYSWSPVTGLSCTACPDPFATPAATITYNVQVFTAYGCSDSRDITITVNPLPIVDAGVDVQLCNGEGVNLAATGAISYSWSPTSGLSNALVANPFANPSVTTAYAVTGENQFGCTATDSMVMTILDKVEAIAYTDTSICVGASAQLHAEVINASDFGVSYLWLPFETLNNPAIPDPVATPSVTTIYQSIVFSGTCEPDTNYVTVTINNPPLVDVGEDIAITLGTEVQLYAVANNSNVSYDWDSENILSCTDCFNPTVVPVTSGYYTVAVTDNNGCVGYDSLYIDIVGTCTPDIIYVPNTFTPNGDGVNDILYIRSDALSQVTTFNIYNRWGQLMFSGKGQEFGWDGMFNGEMVNSGVYVYYIEAICSNNIELKKSGNVTVLR
jgi:gliding motility-associated-like protein